MTYEQVLGMHPEIMIDYLEDEFLISIPESINTIEDMDNAATLLLKLSSSYTYLAALLSRAKLFSREYKRVKDQGAYEDMVDRREAIQNLLDGIKQQYGAISRAVTIKIENNRELQMNNSGYIKR